MKDISMRKLYKEYKDRKSGKEIVDHKKDCGFYFQFYIPRRGTITTMPMQSGKTMIVKLLDYEMLCDPPDMTKWSTWQYLGYVGEKLFEHMTFEEFYFASTGEKLQRMKGIIGWIESKIYR